MKKLFTLFTMLVAMVCTASADNALSVSVNEGRLIISMTNDITVTAYDFHLYLPEGAAIAQTWNEDDEEYVADVTMSRTKSDHGLTVKTDKTDGSFLFGVASPTSKTLKGNEGEILSIGLDLSKVADGTYACSIKTIWFAESGTSGVKPADVDFSIEVKDGKLAGVGASGIEGIILTDNNEGKLYNLAGQRVENAQKGIFIQNGKKVVVK